MNDDKFVYSILAIPETTQGESAKIEFDVLPEPRHDVIMCGKIEIEQWIKIDEEDESTLPDMDDPVFVWLPLGDIVVCTYGYVKGDGKSWSQAYSWYWTNRYGWCSSESEVRDFKPTHWMPLPQPPKKPEGDTK